MIRAVFFDMYGTLAGFEPSRFEVQSEACMDFGIALTPGGVLRGYAEADAHMSRETSTLPLRARSAAQRERFFAEYERLVIRGSGVEVSLETAGRIWRRIQRIPYRLAAFDDAAPTLRLLRDRGLLTGMISNIDRTGADMAADLGIAGLLDVAVTSIEAGAAKPARAIFTAALARADVEAREALHVGDQPSSDIEGALGAGIAAALIDRDGNHQGYDACPRIESLLELPSLIERMDA